MKCAKCGFEKQRDPENFQYRFVKVDGMSTLHQGLSDMVKWDQLEGYRCDKCSSRGSTSRREIPNFLSDTLFFCLKRFEWDWNTGDRTKINSRFEFPHNLNMKPFTHVDKTKIKDEKEYFEFELSGVIVHLGGPASGHYYSYAKRDADDEWFELNDSTTTSFDSDKIKEECFGGVTSTREYSSALGRMISRDSEKISNAFMLLYKRKQPLNKSNIPKALSTDCAEVLKEIESDNAKLSNACRVVSMSTYNTIVSMIRRETLQYTETRVLTQSTLELLQMSTRFFLRVVSRTLIGRAVIVSMVSALCGAYREISSLRRWFLVEQCENPKILLQVLCICPEGTIRTEISKLLSCVLESEVSSLDETKISFDSFEDDEEEQGGSNSQKRINIEKRPLQYFLCNVMCSQDTMEIVATHWKCFHSYFRVLRRLAESGSIGTRLLCCTTKTIMWTADMFLGRRSPLNLTIFKDSDTRKRPKIGSRWENADWSEAFEMLRLLVQSSRASDNDVSLRKDLIPLDEHSKRCLVNRTFFVDALKCQTVRAESIGQIIVHFAFEWKTFSDDVVNLLVGEIASVDVEESNSHLVAVDYLIGILDSLRNARVEGLMGGNQGILTLLRIGSESRTDFTLDCVRRILKLMRTHKHMSAYVVTSSYNTFSFVHVHTLTHTYLQVHGEMLQRMGLDGDVS